MNEEKDKETKQNNEPDLPEDEEGIGASEGPSGQQTTFTATWSRAVYPISTTDLRIYGLLDVSDAPGTTFPFLTSQNIEVQVRSGSAGSYTWSTLSDWVIPNAPATGKRDGGGVFYGVFVTPGPSLAVGTYRLVLKEDTFGTNKPANDVVSSNIVITSVPLTATWGPISNYTPSTRSFSATITLSDDPGSAFSVTQDFEVHSGAIRQSGWTLSSTGTGTTRTITAVPATTVAAGLYQLVLKAGAFGTNRPRNAIVSGQVTIPTHANRLNTGWHNITDATSLTNRRITATLTIGNTSFSLSNVTVEARGIWEEGLTTARGGVDLDGFGAWRAYTAASGWTITATGSGSSRNIVATPDSTVLANVYRLNYRGTSTGPIIVGYAQGQPFTQGIVTGPRRTTYVGAIEREGTGIALTDTGDGPLRYNITISAHISDDQSTYDPTDSQRWMYDLNPGAYTTTAGTLANFDYESDEGEVDFYLTNIPEGRGQILIGVSGESRPELLYPYARGQYVDWTVPTGTQRGTFTVSGIWNQVVTGNSFTSSDITVSTGSFSNFRLQPNNKDFSIDVTPPANQSGTIQISIAARAVTPNNINVETINVPFDSSPFITWDTPTDTPHGAFTVSGTWSQAVTLFTSSDITLSSGTVSNFTETISTNRRFSFTVTPPANQQGNITVTIGASAVSPANKEQEVTIAYDTRQAATVTIGAGTVNEAQRSISWPITLSNSILMGLTDADIISRSPSNVQVGVSISGTTGTITFSGITANTSGTASFSIAADAFNPQSLPSNRRNNEQINSPSVTYDFRDRVTATIGPGVQQPTGRSIRWPVTLSHSLGGFNADDIISRVPAGITVSVTGAGTNYRVSMTGFSANTKGNADFAIRANAFTNIPSSHRNNAQIEAPAAAYDFNPRVNVVIGARTIDQTARTITWPITLSHSSLMGLTDADIINRNPSNVMVGVSVSGTTGTITFSGFSVGANGTASFSIRENAFDSNSLPSNRRNNAQINLHAIQYDFRPRATITIGAGVVDEAARSIAWPITIPSGVTGLNLFDLESATPAGTLTLTGSGTSYTATLSNIANYTSGNASFTIGSNAFTRSSLPANTRNNVRTTSPLAPFDFRNKLTWTAPTGTQTGRFTLRGRFSVPTTGFGSSDLTFTGVTRATNYRVRANRQDISFDLTPPANSNGNITVTLRENRVNPVNAEATVTIPYDTRPRVTATIGTGTINETDRTISWPVTLSHSTLTGFDATDITSRLPDGATVSVTGSGAAYTVTFGPFTTSDHGIADFSIRAGAFTNLPSNHLNNVQVNATGVNFTFLPQPSVTISHAQETPGTNPPRTSQPRFPGVGGSTGHAVVARTRTFTVDFTWDRNVGTAFTQSDISYTAYPRVPGVTSPDATYSPRFVSLTRVSSTNVYRATFTADRDTVGYATLSVPTGVVPATSTTRSSTSASQTIYFDHFLSTYTNQTAPSTLQTGSTTTVSFTPSQSSYGSNTTDFELRGTVNGSPYTNTSPIASITGNPVANQRNSSTRTLTVNIPNNSQGRIRIVAKKDTLANTRGTLGPTTETLFPEFNIDTRPHTATFGTPETTGGTQIPGTITTGFFNLPISWNHDIPDGSFTTSDITLTSTGGYTAGNASNQFQVTNITNVGTVGSRTHYHATIRLPENMTSQATLTVAIAANAVSTGSSAASSTYNYQVTGQKASIAFEGIEGLKTGPFVIVVRFSKNVTGFTVGDIQNIGAGVGATQVAAQIDFAEFLRTGNLVFSQSVYDVTFTPATGTQTNQFQFEIGEDAVDTPPGNVAATSPRISVDNTGTTTAEVRPSIIDWGVPTSTQTSTTFDLAVTFSEDVDIRTSTSTGPGTLDNRASASNQDFTITGTGATGVSFGTLIASTVAGFTKRRFTIPITVPDDSQGTFTLTLNREAVSRTGSMTFGPIELQQSPPIEYDTRDVVPTGPGPSADFTVPTAIQTGTTFDITADFRGHVTGLTADDLSITGVSGASVAIFSEQYLMTLASSSSGTPLPSSVAPSSITINQTKFSGVVVPTTVTRVGSSDQYILLLNRAVDSGTFLPADITIGITNISATALETQDNIFVLRVTPPRNREGTLSLILNRNSVTDFNGIMGPSIDQNTSSIPFNTRTEVVSIVPQQPRGVDIAQLLNGINHWRIVFNRELPVTTFTAANKDTDWSAVVNPIGDAVIGTPERLTATEWIIPVTYPSSSYGSTYFQMNSNAGGLSVCEFRSDIYQWGSIEIPSVNTDVTFRTPQVNNVTRQITIPVSFSNIGNGLESSDFSISATNGTWTAILTSGAGSNERILILTETTQAAIVGSLQVTVAEDAFSDREVLGDRTSDRATYNLGSKQTTVSFSGASVSNSNRTVTYQLTFSNIGTGLTENDFSISASGGNWETELSTGTGGSNTRTLTLFNTDTGSLSGSLTVTLASDAFTDREISGDSAERTSSSAPFNFGAITTAQVTINLDRTSTIRNGQRFFVWFEWNRDITGFTTDDVSINTGTKGNFSGSGRRYKLYITAPEDRSAIVITVRANAVNQGNAETKQAFQIGTGRPVTTVLESTNIIGTGITYTPSVLYTMAQADGALFGTLRTYSHAGILTTTTSVTNGGAIVSRANQTRAIEILNNHFLIGANEFDRIGVARAPIHIPDATISEFFLNVADYRESGSGLTDTVILDIAVGNNQVFVLHSSGTFDQPRYTVDIFSLTGERGFTFDIPVIDITSEFYLSEPRAIVATKNFVYIGFKSFRSGIDPGTVVSGAKLAAWSLDGTRTEKEDIYLGDLSGSQTRYGIQSADWDETNERFFLLLDRDRVIQTENNRYLATLPFPQPVDAAFGTISPQTLEAGNTFDINPYTGGISSIIEGIGNELPSWLSLSNGIITAASSGLPSTNQTANVSLIGIGTGEPAFVNFDVHLRREAPAVNLPAGFVRDAGETIDLNKYFTDASSISFRSGFTVPVGLTMSNGIITIPLVQQQAPVTVHVTGTNPIGSSNGSFSLTINHEATDLRNVSFQQWVPDWTVLIDGVDMSRDVISVDNILHSLDLYDTGQFTVAEATVQISNHPRRYQRDGSFYSDNNVNPFEAEIVVICSIRGIRRRMFIGTVLGINEDINDRRVTLVCVEASRHLRDQQVTNFGIDKYNIGLGTGQSGFEGVYPLPDGLTPSSNFSLTGYSEGIPLNVVENQALRVYGDLDAHNVKQTDTSINTEGGLLEVQPVVNLRSAPLYQRVSDYLRDLLSSEGLNYFDISVPSITADQPFFSSVGRVGYNEEPTDVQRYAKDWIVDSSNKVFYVLSGSPNIIEQDYLWRWTPVTDEWELLHRFENDQEMWQIQSNDYNTFYVLGTEARDDLRVIKNANYDASETESGSVSNVKIWSYSRTTDLLTEFVTETDTYPPTLAHFYSVGFPRDNANSDAYGKVPDTRGGFILLGVNLYYRYASGTDCGVAVAIIPSGSTRRAVSAGNPDNFGNAAGIALHTTYNNVFVYVGYTVAPSDPAELRIVRQNTTGGSVETLGTLNDPTDNSYAFTGVLEIFTTRSTVYFVAQRQPRQKEAPYRRDETANASAVLYSMPYNGGTPTALKEYEYSQTAARSFCLHDGNVHFFEGSYIAYKYEPPDPKWRGQVGRVQKITSSGIEEVGIAWRTELTNLLDPNDPYYGIHGGMASPMHSLDDTLYLIAGYGDFDLVSESGSEINKAYNNAIILLSSSAELRLPTIETNRRSAYNVLNEVALSTNSFYGVDHQKFFWKSRQNLKAQLTSNISDSATSITLKNSTEDFPLTGYLRIGSEIIEYGGLSTTNLTVTARGVAGTTAAAHSSNDEVLYIAHVIDGSGTTSPINRLTANDDYTNLYNSIFVQYGRGNSTYHVEDATSIGLYGRREYNIETLQHFTQQSQAKELGDNYLETFKNLEQILNIESDLALFLSVGDVVYILSKEIAKTARIYEIEHDFLRQSSSISARTIS